MIEKTSWTKDAWKNWKFLLNLEKQMLKVDGKIIKDKIVKAQTYFFQNLYCDKIEIKQWPFSRILKWLSNKE